MPTALGRLIQMVPRPLLGLAFKYRYHPLFSWLRPAMEKRLEGAEEGLPISRGPLSGYRLAFDASDSKVIWMGLHEPEVQRLVLDHLGPGETAFDIGAHIGYFVLLMAKVVGDSGQVVGFEPDSRNFELLRRNIEINDLQKVALASSVALGQEAGLGEMQRGLQSGLTRIDTQESGSVEISTLDKQIYEKGLPKPDLILMDTEGAEPEILRGASRFLSESPPVLIIEHHDRGAGTEKAVLASILEAYRYQITEPASGHLLCVPKIRRRT